MSASDALSIAAGLCVTFEGFSSTPYLCPAGYPTIGYGTVWKPDGTKVTLQDPPIDEPTARAWLMATLSSGCMISVIKLSPNVLKYPRIWGALSDFVYNLGAGRYKISTLRLRVNEENWPAAIAELRTWRRAGGKILPGLVRRRDAEAVFIADL